jgi:hypothetical protein
MQKSLSTEPQQKEEDIRIEDSAANTQASLASSSNSQNGTSTASRRSVARTISERIYNYRAAARASAIEEYKKWPKEDRDKLTKFLVDSFTTHSTYNQNDGSDTEFVKIESEHHEFNKKSRYYVGSCSIFLPPFDVLQYFAHINGLSVRESYTGTGYNYVFIYSYHSNPVASACSSCSSYSSSSIDFRHVYIESRLMRHFKSDNVVDLIMMY